VRRALIAIVAAVGVVVLVTATIVGVNLYNTTAAQAGHQSSRSPTTDPSQQRNTYLLAIASWPYPLPEGVGLPRSTPAAVLDQRSAAGFVSTFFRCAWQQNYVKRGDRQIALSYLTLWSRTPGTDTDRVWRNDVILPAIGGDAGALERLYKSHDCDAYRKTVVPASRGITVDRQQAAPLTSQQMTIACSGISSDVPCNPNFGPDAVIDSGPTSGARGSVQHNAAGVPTSYVVAQGDTFLQVSARFGRDIWSLNCARRANTKLYPGDELNLSIYGVATVGSEDGSTSPKDQATKDACLAQSAIPSS